MMFTGFFHNYSYQFVAKEFKRRANDPVTCFEMYITGHLIVHRMLENRYQVYVWFARTKQNDGMNNENTFGVHYVLRNGKKDRRGLSPVYARISVNGTRCELALKHYLLSNDWDIGKGMAKPKSIELRQFNAYLEEVRGKLARCYRELQMQGCLLTATAVKNSMLGDGKPETPSRSLLWLVAQHNTMMAQVLKPGSLKNYFTTERYLKAFLQKHFNVGDISLKELNYEFITNFEFYVRTTPLKEFDRCENNGTMKHLERLKKIVTWAVKNEWIDKNPFSNYKLKFKRKEREFLTEQELSAIESKILENPVLHRTRDLFVFSCYTGLAFVDLMNLQEHQIFTGNEGLQWIKTTREKTETVVNVPLLSPALAILHKFLKNDKPDNSENVFPRITNQEINRNLKIIAGICEIRKYLTFHLARHTFATTVTLMNGVPIETISKMLGHTKLSTTMIYARVTQSKIGMDMNILQEKFNKKIG